MPTTLNSILALDVGGKRIGVALANGQARLASPLLTLNTGDNLMAELAAIIKRENVNALVVGLPRGLDGQATSQTQVIEQFAADLKLRFALPIYLQDEAVTSRQAEAELAARGRPFKRQDIDALAATYILEDWLKDHEELTNDEI